MVSSPLSTARLSLRHAQASDARAIVLLQEEIYNEGRWFVGDGALSADALARRLRAIEPEMSLYLLASSTLPYQEPEVCGWLELHRPRPRRLQHVAMLTLAVGKDYRKQGVATKLLERSYRWARQVGVEKIQLNVREHNSAAIGLYERQGFELEGREKRQIREGKHYEDNLLMAKFL